MDIKGLSEATITKLWDKGWLKDIVDIYTLKDHRDEWIQMEGFGPKSVDNILAAIEKSKTTTFPTFISALGIPLIGKTVAKDLMNYFSSYEELMDAIVDGFNFSTIDRFGPAKDKALKEFDWSSADYIYENYLDSFTTFAQGYVSSNALDGVTVCITGKLQHFKNREQFKIAIINAGGKVTDSVTKKINYLINNDINSTSSKNKKAKEYNIEIISEGDFIKKFGLNDADS
jgi:DNA ligase (NAD+)